MPILKKNPEKDYFEGYGEIDEHSPYFDPHFIEEKEFSYQEERETEIPFWKRWWDELKAKFFN